MAKRKNTPGAVTSSKRKNQAMRRTRAKNLKRKEREKAHGY